MRIRGLKDEDFVNYRKASMFICTVSCDWKCCIENGISPTVCQNHSVMDSKIIDMSNEKIYKRYIENPMTEAIVIGGLEPMLQFFEVLDLVKTIRSHDCMDDIVIYTGYYEEEISEQIIELKKFPNIVVKFGRFVPNKEKHFDEVLGVTLVNEEQHAVRIS